MNPNTSAETSGGSGGKSDLYGQLMAVENGKKLFVNDPITQENQLRKGNRDHAFPFLKIMMAKL